MGNSSSKSSLEDSSPSDLSKSVPVSLITASLDSFASIFERFNNCECMPVDGMNFVYVLTNEVGLDKTRNFLKQIPSVERGCHIGFSGMHNFDFIAQRRSQYALIFDTNNANTVFLRNVLKILKLSEDRFEFVRNMEALLRPLESCNDFRLNQVQYSIVLRGQELSREGCWLNTGEGYRHVRSVALLDNIYPITQNITKSEVFRDVAELLRSRSIKIDTLYLSNICNYMKDYQEQFCESARFLSNESTIVIHCVARLTCYDADEVAFNQRSIIQSTCLVGDLKQNSSFFSMLTQSDDQVLREEGISRGSRLLAYANHPNTKSAIASEELNDNERRTLLSKSGIVGLFDQEDPL